MIIVGLVAVVGLVVLAAITFGPKQVSPQPHLQKVAAADRQGYRSPSTADYVGSESCAACHPQIAEAYKSHPMAHSIQPVARDSDDAPELSAARIVGDRNAFEVEFAEGRLIHRDCVLDAAGDTIAQQAVKMDYVVGSGERAKAYLFQLDERLFMSPLNWYSQAQKWDMAPGYAIDDPRRFERRVTGECLSCHAGRVAATGDAPDRFENSAFHELAVGCENCHGPGKEHIDYYATSTKLTGDARDPIVNPARLDPERREAVCNQCHLQAAVRLKRPGRGDFDFRPGDRFEDIWAVLDTGVDIDAQGQTRSVNHVQQMQSSACFQKSNGRLGCTSCHDPHRVPTKSEQPEFYRLKCMNCHQNDSCSADDDARLAQGDSCIACHMPSRESNNISHVSQTDHRITRQADRIETAEEAESEGLAFFNREQTLLPEWEQDRALGIGAWIYLTKADRVPSIAVARTLIPVLETNPDDAMTLLALGSIAASNSKRDLARTYFETARSVPAAEEEALIGLLDLEYDSRHWAEALAVADRLIELNDWRAKTHALRGDCLAHLGRHSEAVQAAERALEVNPMLLPVREWLATLYGRVGEFTKQRDQEILVEKMRAAAQKNA